VILLNGIKIEPTIFPDKTSQVWKIYERYTLEDTHNVEWIFESEDELVHLAQLRELLPGSCRLHLPYLPYGRQDKEVSNHSTFALRTFAKLLNAMNFQIVTCLDPHSDMAGKLIRNFEAQYPVSEIITLFDDLGADLVCYPDSGAVKKYDPLLKLEHVIGSKLRNLLTGKIESYDLIGDVKKKKVLIVDDVCDGGATFIHLGNMLRERGAYDVNLYVSHGLFTSGVQVIRDAGINRIFDKEGEV
jgi:ribose-phosphate pyrophosphokinase